MKISLYFIPGLICMLQTTVNSQNISDINHIIHMGQSLAAGEQSMPVVTDSATGFGNLMFKMGTHTWTKRYFEDVPELRFSENFDFIPLSAKVRNHEGETIGNGLCDHLKSTSTPFYKKDFCFLFSFSGQGGRLIRELDKIHDDAKDPRAGERKCGGGYYKTAIDDITRAKKTALLKKQTYSVFALTWMQGEGNRLGHITRWDKPIASKKEFIDIYVNDLVQLKNDFQNDVKNITHQTDTIPFFCYQTAGATIGTAQLMACEREKDMFMVGPTYMLPNAQNSRLWNTQEHGAEIHLSADGQRWLGEMFGKVMRKVVFEKTGWEPLKPVDVYFFKDSKHIRIKFNVPSPPLILDTTFLPKQGHGYGFEVYNKTKVYCIKSVSIVDRDLIELVMDSLLIDTACYSVRYGLQNYAGEISGKIVHISEKDTFVSGEPHIKIEFAGNIVNEFTTIASEGAFKLGNKYTNLKELTSIIVRKVYLSPEGNTTLLGERKDLRDSVPFKTGQTCFIQRGYEYGNIHDSDEELSTFTFSDSSYGSRYGKRYPLYNWCVVFDDLVIEKIQEQPAHSAKRKKHKLVKNAG